MKLANHNIPESIVLTVPESVARENAVMPVDLNRDFLTLACPNDNFGPVEEDRLHFILKRPLRWVRVARDDILASIQRHYGLSGGVDNCTWSFRYQCPHRWINFASTDDDVIRYCSVCQRNVHLCYDDDDVIRHASVGHCIA